MKRLIYLALVIGCIMLAGCGSGPTQVGRPCTCGCDETGSCMCPNCNVGCGFETKQGYKISQ